MADRRPRFEHSAHQHERLTAQFIQACADGDMPALTAILSEDVTAWSDGGGRARAARRPIVRRNNVARFLYGILRKAQHSMVVRFEWINGRADLVVTVVSHPVSVVTLDIADNHIQGIRIILNAEKLRTVAA